MRNFNLALNYKSEKEDEYVETTVFNDNPESPVWKKVGQLVGRRVDYIGFNVYAKNTDEIDTAISVLKKMRSVLKRQEREDAKS